MEVTFRVSKPDKKRKGARGTCTRSNLMAEGDGGWDGARALDIILRLLRVHPELSMQAPLTTRDRKAASREYQKASDRGMPRGDSRGRGAVEPNPFRVAFGQNQGSDSIGIVGGVNSADSKSREVDVRRVPPGVRARGRRGSGTGVHNVARGGGG